MNDKNLKLLEIAGLKKFHEGWAVEDKTSDVGYRLLGQINPDLYNSLDALFLYLLSKNPHISWTVGTNYSPSLVGHGEDGIKATVKLYKEPHAHFLCYASTEVVSDTPAHALAEAILKAWEAD